MGREFKHKKDWSASVEQLEDRQMMSADPVGGFLGGAIEHHQDFDGPIEHHQDFDAIEHHQESLPDFWIDSSNDPSLEHQLQEIEQALANAHNQTGLNDVRNDYGFLGTGQTVAVIDSGIAYDHYALGGGYGQNYRVVGGYDFTENDANPYDDGPSGSHGTHVAGIVGSDDSTHSGVAPGVDLVGLRVFNDVGDGYFSWVESALQWVHDNQNSFESPITAVNLSLGVASWNADTVPAWATLEDEFAQLEADGIFISVSAGNAYTSFNEEGLSYPAASSYVVPVMSVDDNGNLSYFSQRHTRAIAAPGRTIVSTVPDYKGDDNGVTDDWASFSGTSMAAPYVAGASVIIREAMEFVGQTNITQDDIYDHMMDTADSIFDSSTNQWYASLNIDAAIDALMPIDDFGSTFGTAHNLGTITDTASLSGLIGTLSDADYFTFTAGTTGTVSFNATNMTHDLEAAWGLEGGSGQVSGDSGEVFTFDITAGQTYTLNFSSDAGIGYYDFDITTETSFTFTDLGSVYFDNVNDLAVDGEDWYRIEASAAGFLTVESFYSQAGGQVSLQLFDAELQQIDTGNSVGGYSRVDAYASAGEEFYVSVMGTNSDVDLRLSNLVALDGTTVVVNGTTGNDVFAFNAGDTHQVSVNGIEHSFASFSVTDIEFDGGAGNDTITMTGTSGDEIATIRVGQINLSGSGFNGFASSVETIYSVGGGGNDRANLYDSAGSDRFIGRETFAQLSGTGFFNYASDFDRVYAYATLGGVDDRADFYDSAGSDRFVGKSTYAQLGGDGFFNYASGFDRVYAYATLGGVDDRADFYDSAGSDRFVGKSTFSQMSGDGFFNYASGFDRVYAYATAGGVDDRADFYDSAGSDRFVAKPTFAQMSGTGFFNYGTGFDRVYAYAIAGGVDDRADFYDSAGSDFFVSKPDYSEMSGTGYFNYGTGFDRVYAYAINGGVDDRANFYDSAGSDRFVSKPTYSEMSGTGYFNYGTGFDRVYAYAVNGGADDRADFYDSIGDDRFTSKPTYAQMSGTGFFNYGTGFDRVYAYSTAGGIDRADFFDSLGNDRFISKADYAQMSGDGFFNYGVGFEKAYAYATAGGDDRADYYDGAGDDTLYADENFTALSRTGYYMHAMGFDNQLAYSINGGTDDAEVDLVDDAFSLIGDWNS